MTISSWQDKAFQKILILMFVLRAFMQNCSNSGAQLFHLKYRLHFSERGNTLSLQLSQPRPATVKHRCPKIAEI